MYIPKDSVMTESGAVSYKMMGEGDIPVYEMLEELKKNGYCGYVSLEWIKRWASHLSDAGIVFPKFADYMHDYLKTVRAPLPG